MTTFIDNIKLYFSDKENFIVFIITLAIFLLVLLLKNIISKFILKIVGMIIYKKDSEKCKVFINSIKKPLSYFFLITVGLACICVNFSNDTIIKVGKILLIVDVCWIFVSYFGNDLFLRGRFTDSVEDRVNLTAIHFISNLCKVLTIALTVVMVISELGYNINGLIAGLGVGGLAISLAAQETIGNMISGFIIIFDKPFVVGDEIINDSIHGYVEEVKMRSTKIRNLDDSLITIPNSILTKTAVTNISRMEKRRIEMNFGLVYSTSNEVLEKIRKEIEQFIVDDEDILPEPLRLNFVKFEDSSLNYELVCYTKTSDMDEYLAVKNKLNLKIKEIVENNNTSFAFPTTSVIIEK